MTQPISRRDFLKASGLTAAGISLAPSTGFFSKLTHLFAATKPTLSYVRGSDGFYLQVPVAKGSTYESIARNVTGESAYAQKLHEVNSNADLSTVSRIIVPANLVTEELHRTLESNEVQTVKIVDEESSEDDAPLDVQSIVTELLHWQTYGPERTARLVNALNGFTEENTVLPVGSRVVIPTRLVVAAAAEPPRFLPVDNSRFRPKPPAGRRPAVPALLLIKRTLYRSPIPAPWGKIDTIVRRKDRFNAPRWRSGGWITRHKGLDVPCPINTQLLPILPGVIIEIKDYAGHTYWRNGKCVKYRTVNGLIVSYIHLSRFRQGLKVGDYVDTDTVIGFSGISGNASASNPHLHMQVWKNGRAVNPYNYIDEGSWTWKRAMADLRAHLTRSRDAQKLLQNVAQYAP